jgi:hypothetical protein
MFDGLERTWEVGARAVYELFPSALQRNQLPSRLRKIPASRASPSHATIQPALLRFHFLVFHGDDDNGTKSTRVTCLPAIVHRRNRGSSLFFSPSVLLNDSIQNPFTADAPF